MAENGSDNSYKPGPDFDNDNRAPVLPISLSDSTELWLIQWPINQLQPAEFHGKKLSLKLHRDGKLANFENSAGKSYEVVSFASQEPDATVFLPSSPDSKVAAVGKISRRVSLVRYPEPGDMPSVSNPNFSGLRLQGSKMKTLTHLSTIQNSGGQIGAHRSTETLTCGPSIGQEETLETPVQQSRKKKHGNRTPASESAWSIRPSSLASQPKSQMTSAAVGSGHSHGEEPKRKRHKNWRPA